MVKSKEMQFLMENLKKKRKRTKKNDLQEQGFEPQIFSNFPPMICIFMNMRKMRLKDCV